MIIMEQTLKKQKTWTCVEGKNEITFNTNISGELYAYLKISFSHGGSANGGTGYLIQLANVQLERGTKATDFMPAYEDFQEQIDNIEQSSDNIYNLNKK